MGETRWRRRRKSEKRPHYIALWMSGSVLYECIRMHVSVYVHTHNHTHPECERVEGAWVMTDPDWEEDSVCWAARLQLGPIMGPWGWVSCKGWVWGWCSGGWGCGCWGWGGCWSWSWGLSWCWFIQDGPLWESVCGEKREWQTAGTILNL